MDAEIINLGFIKSGNLSKTGDYINKHKVYRLYINPMNKIFYEELLKLSHFYNLISDNESKLKFQEGVNYELQFYISALYGGKRQIKLDITQIERIGLFSGTIILLSSPDCILKMFSRLITITKSQLYYFTWNKRQQKIFVFRGKKNF